LIPLIPPLIATRRCDIGDRSSAMYYALTLGEAPMPYADVISADEIWTIDRPDRTTAVHLDL